MIRIGGDATGKPEHIREAGSLNAAYSGKVVYIHPERRYYTVEWNFYGGKFRYRETRYFYPRNAAHGAGD